MVKTKKTENNKKINNLEGNIQDVIKLMDIYLSEWKHRDAMFWKQVFTFFYAALLVLLLPHITDFLRINLPSIPTKAFYITGMVISAVSLFVSFGYLKRLEAIHDTYKNLISKLEPDLQRIKVEDLEFGKMFGVRMGRIGCLLMFLALIGIGIILLLS